MNSGRDDLFADLAPRLGGRLLGATPLKGGVSARVVALDLALPDGTVRRVVYREPGAAAWKGAVDTARREHDLLAWLHAHGLPVPRPLLLDVSRGVAERPFFVMDHVTGSPDPADLPAALTRMADVLAEIHGMPLDGAPALPEREDPVAGLLELLPAEHDPLRARLIGAPPRLAFRPSLLHGDYWPGNLLWRDGDLAAVLDWEDAAIGDPLSDLACCRLELRYRHGASAAAAFTARYADVTQAELTGLPVWDAYVSAAALVYMGHWGLDPALEAHMRREAGAVLREAAGLLG